MDTLKNMRAFVRVVEARSFTGAAAQLSLTTAFVSRAVSDLETRLQTRLLIRTTRRIALTEAGERYLQRCQQILADVERAELEASDAYALPSGKLRVHAMTSFGQQCIVPVIGRYQQAFPLVSVDLTLSQRTPDLLDDGYDVSLVLAPNLPDSGLVSQRLGSVVSIVCVSPGYLARGGAPQQPSDLREHACLHMVTPIYPPDEWTLSGPHGEERIALGPARFQCNNAEAVAVAVREGMGIGLLPIHSVIDGLRAGDLVRILSAYSSQQMNIYAVYASRQYLDAKIRTWVEFLRSQLPTVIANDQADLRRSAQT